MPRVVVGFAEHEVRRIRALALAGYEEARSRQWPFLSDVLGRLLHGVPVEDAAVVAAVVQALVRYDRLLAFASGNGDAGARLDALLAMVRGDVATDARVAAIERRVERIAVTHSFPDWLVTLVEEDVGPESVEAALASMNALAPRVARVNALKSTREACLEALAAEGLAATATPHSRWGIAFEGRSSPFRTAAFARGDFEMQDEASQMVAEVVAPPPGGLVIDACAGAGGKALALAAGLGGRGRVVALDIAEAKLEELRRRARRAGASNVQAIQADLLKGPLAQFEGKAERVLVDAPCTGLGAIRRNPEVRWRLTPDQMTSLAETQRKLLRMAAALVAPKGRLVYATCSFLKREGEAVLADFLAADPRFTPVTARDVLGRTRSEAIASGDGRYLQTWRSGGAGTEMDGFFAGVTRRTG